MNALLFVFEISLISGGNLLSCQRDLNCGFIGLEKSTTSASRKTLCVHAVWNVSDL